MQVFIANIDSISKHPDVFASFLGPLDAARLSSFQNQTRKLQFILGHLMAIKCGDGHASIAHKDNLVVVAFSNDLVGVDIENTTVQRDFAAMCEMLNLKKTENPTDFYKCFTKYEAEYKLGTKSKCVHFFDYDKYLICVASNQPFEKPELTVFDVNSILTAE